MMKDSKSGARHFVTGLLGRARALFHGLGPKGEHPSRDEPDYVKDARRNPQNYFYCTGCGSGPWHNSWAAIQTFTFNHKLAYDMPKKPLGGCCSGAD